MTVQKTVETMITTLTDALGDASKHDSGNSAAGGRLRKTLQTVAVECKTARTAIQTDRNTRKTA